MSKLPLEGAAPLPSAPPCYDEVMTGSSCYPQLPHNPPHVPYPQQAYVAPVPVIHQPVPQQRIIVAAPAVQVIRPLMVGPRPLTTTCSSCHKHITSRTCVKYRYTPHICCFLLLITLVCSCFSCLPYCLCPSERVEHTCPQCNAYLGTYVRSK